MNDDLIVHAHHAPALLDQPPEHAPAAPAPDDVLETAPSTGLLF